MLSELRDCLGTQTGRMAEEARLSVCGRHAAQTLMDVCDAKHGRADRFTPCIETQSAVKLTKTGEDEDKKRLLYSLCPPIFPPSCRFQDFGARRRE